MWIRNAQVLTSDPSRHVDICIQKGLISKIQLASKPKIASGFDASSYWLSPGFVNAHTHVAMSFMKSLAPQSPNLIRRWMFPIESKLTEEDVYIFSKMGIVECLLGGSTTIFDHYYFPHAIAQAAEELGIRAAIAPTVLSRGGPFSYETLLSESKSFLTSKKYGTRIIPVAGPHATDTLEGNRFRKLVEFAQQENLPIHLHVSQTQKEFFQMKKERRMTPIQFLDQIGCFKQPTLVAHAIYLEPKDFSILKKGKATVAICPSSLALFDQLSPLIEFDKRNISYALGTDSDLCNDTMDILKEIRNFILFSRIIQKSATPKHKPQAKKVLKFAQSQALTLLRKPELKGKIEVGQVADLLFIRKDSPNLTPIFDPQWALAMNCRSEDIRHVMVNGQWVIKNRALVSGEFNEIRDAFLKRTKKLLKKAGLTRLKPA